jgi:hypothetical protein
MAPGCNEREVSGACPAGSQKTQQEYQNAKDRQNNEHGMPSQ